MNEEIDLSQFELKDTLNPSIWEKGEGGYVLRNGVKKRIMKIVKAFWEDFLGFETEDINDILLVGSSCNYNWSDVSDLDVHLEVDFAEIDDNTEIIEDYFKTKSRNWNDAHNGLHIGNTPIELFVQDINSSCGSTAKYSLIHDEWIDKPKRSDLGELKNDNEIQQKAAMLMTIIDGIDTAFKNAKSEELGEIYDDIQDLLSKLLKMRKNGLDRSGEMDKDNIVYKVLRRSGHLQLVWDLSDEIFDRLYSDDE